MVAPIHEERPSSKAQACAGAGALPGGLWRKRRPPSEEKGQRTDEQIKSAIEDILTDDPLLDASGIQVSVQQGIALLSGTVASREAKRRAEDLTDQIMGVRDVQNTLSIVGL